MLVKTFIKIGILILSLFASSNALGNLIGGETQNFNPTTDGKGFVTVHSARLLEPFNFNIGYFGNYAVNTLPIFKEDEGQTRYSDKITSSQFHFALGLSEYIQFGVAMPYLNEQELYTSGENQGRFIENGNTGTAFHSKIKVWKGKSVAIATIASVYKDRIKDNPFVGEAAGPTYTLELAIDRQVGKHLVGLNIGHRWRNPGEPIEEDGNPIRPLRDQFIFSAGATLGIAEDHSIIAELFGGIPTQEVPEASDRLESSSEILIGYKIEFFKKQLAFHIGAGSELIHGHSSPDWRTYGGVNWSPKVDVEPEPKPKPKPKPVVAPQPKMGPLGPIKAKETIIVNDVLFHFDSSTLILKGMNRKVAKLPAHLKTPPEFTKLVIVGHTDSVGSRAYNRGLSLRRAQSIKNWLIINHKLDPKKIVTIGQGEDFPIASNKVAAGRKRNRRVEFKIYRQGNQIKKKKKKTVRSIRY